MTHQPEAALPRTPVERQNAETVLKMFGEGWGTSPGWQNVWRAHADSDMVAYFNGEAEPSRGLQQFLLFQEGLFAGFPTIETTVTDVTVETDTVIVQSLLEGTHDGEFLGIPASGARVQVPDVTVFRLKHGRIVEVRYFTDLLAVMTAIGGLSLLSA
ncbi:ester cyclase [Tabrizicola sp.]|uniref:ester cyclase n=1 Tax=Tabrizicola sp. TaxID=2005166 RepID=UPI003F2DCB03